MANSLPHALDDCRREEETLSRLVADDALKIRQIDESLSRHRELCGNALLADFNFATSPAFRAEHRLWDNHQKVNGRFRAHLASLRKSSEKKPVELRKFGHEYLKFIKGSQSFYRLFVKRLDQTYGGIPSLHRVAQKLHSDLLSESHEPSPQQPSVAQLEQFCHQILIRLGDLSRYRETELASSEKNWGPAHGYYDLALTVCPNSGIPFNQRAVIALSDKTLFRSLYYVYRSISAQEPHPQGEQNLRRALQKVQQAWNSKELTSDPQASAGSALPKGMVAWYLRLLEMFFHGKSSPEKEELESEVMTQLKFDLLQKPSAEPPRKFVLTAIAAQHTAQERFEQNQSNMHQTSYLLFLQLNVKLFSCLLSVFIKAADSLSVATDKDPGSTVQMPETGPVLRRLLPVLRLYGLWLEKTCAVVSSPVSGLSDVLKTELWSSYAKVLSLMIENFPPESISAVSHMLEEDEDTIGFKPLFSPKNRSVWYQNEELRPRWHEVSSENGRNVEMEMAFRMRQFTLQGLDLALAKRIPITFEEENRRFTYDGDQQLTRPLPEPQAISENSNQARARTNGIGEKTSNPNNMKTKAADEAVQDQEAARMVENIVGGASALAVENSNEDLQQDQVRPTTSLHRSSMLRRSFGAASTLPTGTHTVSDIMAATYKQPKSTSPQSQNIDMQRSRSGSRPTSSIHSPTMQQQQLRYSSDVTTKQPSRSQFSYPEDPDLPGLGITRAPAAQSLPLNSSSPQPSRPSPLPPPATHSRTNSGDISNIWGGGIFAPSYTPAEMSPRFAPDTAAISSLVPNTFPEYTNTSQMLQGVTNTWNYRGRESQTEISSGPMMPSVHGSIGSEMAARDLTGYKDTWNESDTEQFTQWHQA